MNHSRALPRVVRLLAFAMASLLGFAALGSGGEAHAGVTAKNLFSVKPLYVDPNSAAGDEADELRVSDPAAAATLDKVAAGAQADWYGDWNPSSTLAQTVSARAAEITAAGALPVFVAYDIPMRDCGSYSGGGAASAAAYRAWIDEMAKGIGFSRKAVVILEPDALAQLDCLPAAKQTERLSLLNYAVNRFYRLSGTAVYVDAGHADWIPAAEMADRLETAGVAKARGFAVNVSNFGTTADQIGYADALADLTGGKHAVIDTSRNGLGPASGPEAWCNPDGRALGAKPGSATGDATIDAFVWVKHPGESDGECGSGDPAAGTWWPEYAVGLGERATW